MTGSFAFLVQGKLSGDLSPLERAQRRDFAARIAQGHRADLAYDALRRAMLKLREHHTLQNLARGRSLDASRTLRLINDALKDAERIKAEPGTPSPG